MERGKREIIGTFFFFFFQSFTAGVGILLLRRAR